jgi:hypothetical protein
MIAMGEMEDSKEEFLLQFGSYSFSEEGTDFFENQLSEKILERGSASLSVILKRKCRKKCWEKQWGLFRYWVIL